MEIEEILSRLYNNEINIEQLSEEQKDKLMFYYNQEIYNKKRKIKDIKKQIRE